MCAIVVYFVIPSFCIELHTVSLSVSAMPVCFLRLVWCDRFYFFTFFASYISLLVVNNKNVAKTINDNNFFLLFFSFRLLFTLFLGFFSLFFLLKPRWVVLLEHRKQFNQEIFHNVCTGTTNNSLVHISFDCVDNWKNCFFSLCFAQKTKTNNKYNINTKRATHCVLN